MVDKYPSGVTSDGIKYSDFLAGSNDITPKDQKPQDNYLLKPIFDSITSDLEKRRAVQVFEKDRELA